MPVELPTRPLFDYVVSAYPVDQDDMFKADSRPGWVSSGVMGKADLLRVVDWKSQRQKGNAGKNSEDRIAQASALALQPFLAAESYSSVSAADVHKALELLTPLHGVSTRMTSAILTVFRPDLFTVLDVRAWATLKRYRDVGERNLDKHDTYVDYLEVCHELRDEMGVSLRNLDRFLFVLNGRTHLDYVDARRREGCFPSALD